MPQQPNIDEIKARVDLAREIERFANLAPSRSNSIRNVYLSPWRNERTPSFYVYHHEQKWCDFGKSSNRSGDIFDFMFEYGVVPRDDYNQAKAVLLGNSYVAPEPIRREPKKKAIHEEVSLERIVECLQWMDVSENWWSQYGVNHATVEQRALGAVIEHEHTFTLHTGKKIRTTCLRYVIPNIRPNPATLEPQIVNVNTRRSDKDVTRAWTSFRDGKPETVQAIRETLSIESQGRKKPEEYEERHLIDALFGPKYYYWKPYNAGIFNSHVTVEFFGENRWEPKPLPYVILVEAEKCAIALCDAGYPAIAAKYPQQFDFNKFIHRNTTPLFAYDNDSAGFGFAMEARKKMGRGMSLSMLPGHKDPSDMCAAGVIHQWAERHFIERLPEEFMALPEGMVL